MEQPSQNEVREVPLTNGGVAYVDAEDYDKVMERSWYANHPDRQVTYACSNYSTAEGRGIVYLHCFLVDNVPDGLEVDHRDNNRLNCCKHNLRLATRSQNNINRVMPQGPNGTGYRGVQRTKADRFRVSLRIEGRITNFGTFDTPEEAARAYDVAAREHHGEFAVLNFEPDNGEE